MAEPDIAVLTFDAADKGANVLSRPVLEELERHLDELEKKKDLKGLILDSAKPGIFIFGADVREFLAAKNDHARDRRSSCRRAAASCFSGCRISPASRWPRSTAVASAAAPNCRCGAIAGSCPTAPKPRWAFRR